MYVTVVDRNAVINISIYTIIKSNYNALSLDGLTCKSETTVCLILAPCRGKRTPISCLLTNMTGTDPYHYTNKGNNIRYFKSLLCNRFQITICVICVQITILVTLCTNHHLCDCIIGTNSNTLLLGYTVN